MKKILLEAIPLMVILITLTVAAPPKPTRNTTTNQNENRGIAIQNSNRGIVQNSNRGIGKNSNADVALGTWKLNEAKSKIGAGSPKNHTVVYERVGDSFKVTVDGTDSEGNATHSEWTGKFDGKDYAVTGDPNSDMRSYRQINSRTLALTAKKDNRVTLTGRIVLSANGRSRTVTTTGTNSTGQKVKTTAVYDKQ